MDNQTQKQSEKPDYSFILNQPGFEPKKRKKPTVLLILAVAGVVVLVGTALVLSVFAHVSSQNGAKTQQDAANKPVQDYFALIVNGKSDEAYNLFTPAVQNRVTKTDFVQFSSGALNTSFDLSKCISKSNPQVTNQTAQITYTCPTRDNKRKADFIMGLVIDGNIYKINTYDMKALPV
ncbi:MAG: hypothetical protein WCJ24_03670 [Candidatus Saccharibacteria bacterium]